MRSVWLALLLVSCAEVKNQARLGLGGSGSSYAPRQPEHGRDAAAASAAIGPAVGAAAGAAVVSRVLGGCVAACPPGTGCNAQTGLCDTLPCRGQCRDDEICQNDKCVPAFTPGLIIEKKTPP